MPSKKKLFDVRLGNKLTPTQILQIIYKMIAVFFFIAYEIGFKFDAQPQTGAYSY